MTSSYLVRSSFFQVIQCYIRDMYLYRYLQGDSLPFTGSNNLNTHTHSLSFATSACVAATGRHDNASARLPMCHRDGNDRIGILASIVLALPAQST